MQMDFKKTILWAVFSMSGLLLYNNWQVHEGKPSMFGGNPAGSAAVSDKAPANKIDVPTPIQSPSASTPNQAPAVMAGAVETGSGAGMNESSDMKGSRLEIRRAI
ncbi:MAG: hypothetical protein CFE26_17675 [Verrucomicrobiales bacterium VVV1]|nr:MAG: hypothetical protein CFE26_17675 [Verrucomicrobiales bacterium VVV1]